MLNVLLSCFMSFAVLGSSAGVNFIDSRAATPQAYSNQPNISYEAVKVAEWRNWAQMGIGNHRMVQIKSCEYKGLQPTNYITDFYNTAITDEINVTKEVTTITETAVSTTVKEESCITTALHVQAGVPGASISADLEVKESYTIEKTTTYTTTHIETTIVNFNIRPEYLDGRHLAVAQVADVYEITYDTWVVENWWWGQYETDGTRRTGKAYLTYDPFITIVYQDGEIVL